MADSPPVAERLPADRLRVLASRLKEKRALAIPVQERATGVFPLSFPQERLWFLDRLSPGTSAYNVPGAARLSGPLRVPLLAASLDGLIARHAALRTTFGDEQGRPFQRVATHLSVPLPLADLSALPAAARERELTRLATAEARRPFDLARGPLVRALLLRLATAEHAVIYTLHHIVSDGWSSRIFLQDMAALYAALAAGPPLDRQPAPVPLPLSLPLPLQYPDFAVWQRQQLAGEALARQLDYWRRQLAGLRGATLPADRPRPAVETLRGRARPVTLPAAVAAAVRELAQREGVSLFMVLLAAFDVLLYRLTGEADVPVGSPTANRNRRELEGVIGFFANTLVLRGDLRGHPTFRELLGRIKEMTLAAYAHQDLPFERVVEAVQPERDLSRNPLFQVMCVLQNQPRRVLPAGELTLETLHVDPGAAKFDLTLLWSEEAERLGGTLEYSTDLFDGATVLRFFRGVTTVLASAAAAAGQRIDELALLSAAERQAVLHEWNDTAAPLPERLLPAVLAAHAAARPNAVALAGEAESMTYGALYRAAGGLARHLWALGVGRGSRVALCLPRSPAFVVGLAGILEAGAAFLPLDPAYPEERLAWTLRDAGVLLAVTGWREVVRLAPYVERILCLDKAGAPEAEEPPRARGTAETPPALAPPALEADDAAYVIYTSGSTGEPKGAVLGHGGLANLAFAYGEACGIGSGDRFLQLASPAFDASVVEVAVTLAAGATLCLAPREDLLPGPGLLRVLAEREVTAMTLPPSVLAVLPPREPKALPALATVIAGGEPLPAALAARWGNGGARARCNLINGYGPTEATVCATVSVGETGVRKPAIGRPLANVEAHALDRELRPVPIGAPGELCLGGAGLASGYWNRPALTAERFVPHPLGDRGARLYRTGDEVRRLASGEIDFLARLDDQVKVRGFRIEPGEIETALLGHPAVAQAAVVARPFRPGDLRLVAYVALREGSAGEVPPPWGRSGEGMGSDLAGFLRARLPEHLVPALFNVLPELPRTASGKVDRARLLTHIAGLGLAGEPSGKEAAGYLPPRTPVEEALAGIWAAVLGRARVGANDDFFALSGNSLLAAQVAYRIQEALGVDLPLRRLFERPRLAELALEIESAAAAGTVAAAGLLPPLAPAPRDQPLPASFMQEWGWQLQGGPVSAELNMPVAQRLRGRLHVPALALALAGLVRRHEALRTRFHLEAGKLFQIVEPADAWPAGGAWPPGRTGLPLVDLSALPSGRNLRLARQLLVEEADRPFDMTRAPLLRTLLLRLEPTEHVLVLNVHHAVSDGWSIEVLQRELRALYGAFAAGRPSPLAALPLQYADFACWQRQALVGEALEAQLGYWRRRLAGRPPALAVPTVRPRPAELSLAARFEHVQLLGEMADQVRELARGAACTLSMTLAAAVVVLLHRYTGERDVLLSTLFSGRTRPELTGIVGLFLNMATLRVDLSGEPSFAEVMRRVRADVLASYRHQDLPFPVLLARLFPEEEPSRNVFSHVTFNMLSFSGEGSPREAGLAGLAVEPFPGRGEQAKCDLTFTCQEEGEDVLVQVVGAADLFGQPELARIAEDFAALLAAAAAEPEIPLSRLLPA